MRISEVTEEFVLKYLKIDLPDETDKEIINNIMPSALGYITEYTGQTAVNLDKYEDVTFAYLILIEDMFDNRSMTVNSSNINRTVKTILAMHSLNNVG